LAQINTGCYHPGDAHPSHGAPVIAYPAALAFSLVGMDRMLQWGVLAIEFLAILFFLIELPRRLARFYPEVQNWWSLTSRRRSVKRLAKLQADWKALDAPIPIAQLQIRFYVSIFMVLYLIGAGLFSFVAPFLHAASKPDNIMSHKGLLEFSEGFIVCGIATAAWGLFYFTGHLPSQQRVKRSAIRRGIENIEKKLGVLYELRFDYLPTATPFDNGWTKASANYSAPTFGQDSEIPGSLFMQTNGKVFAMDHDIPSEAQSAHRMEFEAKFIKDAIVYAEVIAINRYSEQEETWWFGHVLGNRGPEKQQGREWKFYVAPRNDREFCIDLRKEADEVLAETSQIFKGLCKLRLRGDISISSVRLSGD
jgi:hypothetical protein